MSPLAKSSLIAVLTLVYALVIWIAAAPPVRAAGCQQVIASWYGTESCVNKRDCRTANGERFTGRDLTAAHKSLPFGTKLRVTYGKRSLVVRINDRGPFIKGRSLDLSRAAASQLGMQKNGVATVCITKLP